MRFIHLVAQEIVNNHPQNIFLIGLVVALHSWPVPSEDHVGVLGILGPLTFLVSGNILSNTSTIPAKSEIIAPGRWYGTQVSQAALEALSTASIVPQGGILIIMQSIAPAPVPQSLQTQVRYYSPTYPSTPLF